MKKTSPNWRGFFLSMNLSSVITAAIMNRVPCSIYFPFDWTTNSNRSNQNHLCRNLHSEMKKIKSEQNPMRKKIRLDSVKKRRKGDSPEKKVECTNASRSPPEREGSNDPCPPRPLLLLFDFLLLLPRKDDDFFWMEGRDDDEPLVSSGISQTSIFASRCFLFSDGSPGGSMVADVWMQQEGSWLISFEAGCCLLLLICVSCVRKSRFSRSSSGRLFTVDAID